MYDMNGSNRRRFGWARYGRASTTFLVAALAMSLGACGDNLFGDGGGGIGAPEIRELEVPDVVDDGDPIDVTVRATSERRIAEIQFRLRGALDAEAVHYVAEPRSDVTVDTTFRFTEPAKDSLLIIQVKALDQASSSSEFRTDTVRVRDVTAPTASIVVDPIETGSSDTVTVTITARDNVGVSELGFLVLGADGDTISLELAQQAGSIADSVSQTWSYVVPDSLPPGTIRMFGLARDISGLDVKEPDSVIVTILDRTPPTVTITRPGSQATYPIGDSIRVDVDLVDNSGVVEVEFVGLAYRGDPDLGTDEVITRYEPKQVTLASAPQDTTLRRFIVATPETASELVSIIVTARDETGNVGADTVEVSVGGPRVEILSPADGEPVQSGRSVGVQIMATDPSGISRVELTFSGVASGSWVFPIGGRDSVVVDTAVTLPAGTAGRLELTAAAVNMPGVTGRGLPIVLNVQNEDLPDETPPTLSFTVSAPKRMEMTDSLKVLVRARDNDGGSGIARMGVTAIAVNSARTDTVTQSLTVSYAIPRSGTAAHEFVFHPFHVDVAALPDTLEFEIHAFAVDAENNCAAASSNRDEQLGCRVFKGDTIASGAVGTKHEAIVVTGRTIRLPNGGRIADAVVEMDTANSQFRLYLSNIMRNQVEVLNLVDATFGDPIWVGAKPWGLFVDPSMDTLFVANSGGTNISLVQMNATPRELLSERVLTPEAVLYEIKYDVDEIGRIRYTVYFYGFSDRPQFIAQDSVGRLLYSTVPTGAAPDGTIRVVDRDPVPGATDDEPEIRILFDPAEAIEDTENYIAIANVDSIVALPNPTGSDDLVFYDHVPGYPHLTVSAGTHEGLDFWQALDSLAARSGDPTIVYKPGRWVLERVGMSDTTFVSAAGDRGRIAFGEGATNPTGRIILWDAARAGVSHEVAVADLVDNASERVLGVGLNQNGTVGVARGSRRAYFFNQDLRQLGEFDEDLGTQSAGAALHWAHDAPLIDGEIAVAFIGGSNQSIKIVSTDHFTKISEIPIRDNIVGPLRVTPPLPSDNGGQGASCAGPDCVVAKLYGVTAAGGVVVVDVLRRDVTR